MPGILLQIRTVTNPYNPTDFLYAEEWVFDTLGKRLAICNAGVMMAYPSVDNTNNQFTIEYTYQLVSNDKQVALDFNDLNELKINIKGVTIASFKNGSQTIRVAADGHINRTGPQSIENVYCYPDPTARSVPCSLSKYTLETIGNISLEVNTTDKEADKTVVLNNLRDLTTFNGVRNNAYGNDRSTALHSRGTLSMIANSDKPWFANQRATSRIYYPGAANHDLTFYMIYRAESLPMKFITRIGFEGNWQYFATEIPAGGALNGCLAFHFKKDSVLPANRNKTIRVDWISDMICNASLGLFINRGVSITSMSVYPGHVKAEHITPTFAEYSTEMAYASMYTSGDRTQQVYGRTVTHVNFDKPMISADYDIIDVAKDYVYSVSKKTRNGFTIVSTIAPTTTRWSFTYRVVCK